LIPESGRLEELDRRDEDAFRLPKAKRVVENPSAEEVRALGRRRVADVYFTEYARIFNRFYWRKSL
jgi:hypothetical protein